MKKKVEKNEKEEVTKSTVIAKTYAVFFLLLVLEAVLLLSGIRQSTTTNCTVDDKEYYITVEKSKGIPWLLNIFDHDGITYKNCNTDDCESVYDSKLNKECFQRSDIHKSLDCARKQLCEK